VRTYQVISGDGHVEVPAEMLATRIPAKYRDQAPTLVVKDDGSEWWKMGDQERENVGNLVGGSAYDELRPNSRRYHNPDGSARPGTGDAVQRLREQDLDGLDAEVLYPPVYGAAFLRTKLEEEKEKDAYLAIVQAYNSFLAEDYCSVAPDRLIGNAIIPETGVDDAIAEMERCKNMGLPSVCLAMWPNGGEAVKPEDDRFWAAALDLDMKISPHGTFGGAPPPVKSLDRNKLMAGLLVTGAMYPISQAITSGIFDRFPSMRWYFAEHSAGFSATLPSDMNRLDEYFLRWNHYFDVHLSKLPSDYVKDHVRFGFVSDRMVMKFRHYIGVDLLLWGSDLPHSVSTFPNSQLVLQEYLEGVPEVERRKVLVENACDFFGLDPHKELTPTP
jgi:predicted TIM-barrel fold metal-dependent hydrolase